MLSVVAARKGHKCRGAEVQCRVAASRAVEEQYDRIGAGIDGRIPGRRVIIEVHRCLATIPVREVKGRRAGGRLVLEEEIAADCANIYHITGSGAVVEKDSAGELPVFWKDE